MRKTIRYSREERAQNPTVVEIDAMFLCVYGWRMRDSGHSVEMAVQCPRGDARALWHAKALRGTIMHK